MNELDILIKKAKEAKQEAEDLELKAKERKAEYKELLETEIPTYMVLNNMAEYVNLEGEKVSYKTDYRGSAAKARMDEIIDFLGEHGEASGFKHTILIETPYEPDGSLSEEQVGIVRKFLTVNGIDFKEEPKIHHQTLEATLRRLMPELIEKGDQLAVSKAEELLKVAQYYKTSIKDK